MTMTLFRDNLYKASDRIALFSVYAIGFFLPISKAIIETMSYVAIIFFIVKIVIGRRPCAGTRSISLAILIYALICLLSIFTSTNSAISVRSFLGKVLQDITFFFVVIGTLNKKDRLRNFLAILFASSLLLGIDGIYQSVTHKDFIRNRPDLMIPRIYASFYTPNDFGCYLVSVMPYVIAVFFSASRILRARFFTASLFILLFICLMLTVSKGAWIAFLGSVSVMCIWLPPVRLLLVFIMLFVAVTLFLFPPFVKERLSSLFTFLDQSSLDRKKIWSAAWKMFLSRPWLGLGLGTFMFNFESFVAEGYAFSPPYAHNCYLQMLAEIGIIGLVAFLAILAIFFYRGIKTIRNSQRTFCWYVLLGSLAAALGYCVQMGVDTFLYSVDLGLLFWLILGIGIAAMDALNRENNVAIGRS